MPITVHAYKSVQNDELRNQIERLYDISPEFADGQDALLELEHNLAEYTLLYTAELAGELIAAMWSTGQGSRRTLEYVVVHPEHRGRGVAEHLVQETCRMDAAQGVTEFKPGCGAIHRCLVHLGKI